MVGQTPDIWNVKPRHPPAKSATSCSRTYAALLPARRRRDCAAVRGRCRRRGPAVARTLGLVLTLYLVDALGGLWNVFGAVRWASPFHYFKPIDMVVRGVSHPSHVGILLLVFAATETLPRPGDAG